MARKLLESQKKILNILLQNNPHINGEADLYWDQLDRIVEKNNYETVYTDIERYIGDYRAKEKFTKKVCKWY